MVADFLVTVIAIMAPSIIIHISYHQQKRKYKRNLMKHPFNIYIQHYIELKMNKEIKKKKMSLVTEEIRAKAIIYYDKEIIKEQSQRLLKEVGLPNGLLPLVEPEECGYVEETGFVWLKQKNNIEHKFDKIGKLVSYATEVTAYAEPCKIKKLTGVKVKELLFWISLSEISVKEMNADKVTFTSYAGPSRTFPADAFVAEPSQPESICQVKEV